MSRASGGTGRLSRPLSKKGLRTWVMRELEEGGFHPHEGRINPPDLSKEGIRTLHWKQRESLLVAHIKLIDQWEDTLLKWFADGTEVDPENIDPHVIPVKTDEEAALFRYASLLWSVPVSQGYGRRTRFLVVDRSNDRLIGLFALGDPVYNLTARDTVIGWNAEQRSDRLYNVLDAFVLGAVPPYRQLIGGKLVAMAAVSDTTLDFIAKKYQGAVTKIQNKIKSARPVLITTTSSLGRSSIYNRLRYRDHLLYQPVGWTQGFGHFQFSMELFDALKTFVNRDGNKQGNRYGDGPNWRIRTLRASLTEIGLDPELIRHGVQRQVFLAPVAKNWKRYLLGEIKQARWCHFDLEAMATYYRERWAIPRSERDASYKEVKRESLRLSTELLRP